MKTTDTSGSFCLICTSRKTGTKQGGGGVSICAFFIYNHFRMISMPTTDSEDLLSYQQGTKNAGAKLVRKYVAAADKTLKRLQSEDTQKAWEEALAAEEAKKAYEQGRKNLSKSDLTNGMTEKGKSNYETSTGAKSAQEAWVSNGKEYRDAAKKFSEDKPTAKTPQEKVANMSENMIRQMNIKRKKLGLPELT